MTDQEIEEAKKMAAEWLHGKTGNDDHYQYMIRFYRLLLDLSSKRRDALDAVSF